MKGKQLAIVLILLVALGGVALFLSRRNAASWSRTATTSEGKILDFPLNDVSHVTIKERSVELNLVKKDDVWRVTERADYPADFDKVSALIRKLWELRPVQDVKIGPSQLGRLQLVEPSPGSSNDGTRLDLKGAGEKRLAALLLGKKLLRNSDQPTGRSGFPFGRYVMGQDALHRVFLISDTLDEAQTKPEQWLNHDFIKVENPMSIAVAGMTPGMNWKIVRDTASSPWRLVDEKQGEELDSAKISVLATLFSGASFVDVLTSNDKPAETGLDKPSTVRIETFDNFGYELRIGKLLGDNYPVLVSVIATLPKERTAGKEEKPEEKTKLDLEFQTRQKELADKLAKEQKLEKHSYLLPKATIDQLLKDRNGLMAEKKTSPTPTARTSATAKSVSPAPSLSPRRRPK